MSKFSTTKLADGRVLVQGTDGNGTAGKTILDGTQWDVLKSAVKAKERGVVFDEKVKEFFAPLLDLVKHQEEEEEQGVRDPAFHVVLNEGTKGEAAVPEEVVHLSKDSAIIRMIENGDTERLIWITDSVLEILAPVNEAAVDEAEAIQFEFEDITEPTA